MNRILVWFEGSVPPSKNITGNLKNTTTVFVTVNGDVYVDTKPNETRYVEKWTMNATNGTTSMYVEDNCYGLFVDVYESIYCSLPSKDKVVQRSVSDDLEISRVVAGNGTARLAPNTLDTPRGIFIDTNLSLYVADCGNNRIQRFQFGQVDGLAVAGKGALQTYALNCPSSVVLDADGYLFIVETAKNRVVGSGPNGFRCIIACAEVNGSAPNQLSNPRVLSFDSYGNLYVTDGFNNRIQKFTLRSNNTRKFEIS